MYDIVPININSISLPGASRLFRASERSCCEKAIGAPAIYLYVRFWQVYELNKGKLKLVHERETDAGIKCCTFGASSLENRHLVRFSPSLLQRSRLTAVMC